MKGSRNTFKGNSEKEDIRKQEERDLIQHFGTPKDLPLRLYPTSNCNFNCRTPLSTKFCDHQYHNGQLPTVTEMITLFTLFKQANLANIVKISGREPTLYPHIEELVRSLRRVTKKVTLSTNGTGSIELMGNLIKEGISIVTISFPSLNPEKFAFATGLPHFEGITFYQKLQEMIEFLRSTPVKLHFNQIIMKGLNDSPQEMNNFLTFCHDHNALAKIFDLNCHLELNHVYNSPARLTSSAQDVWKQLFVDLHPLKESWKARAKKIARYENEFSPRIVFQLVLDDGTELLFDEFRPFVNQHPLCQNCPSSKFCREGPYANGWEIAPDLKLYPCVGAPENAINFQNPDQIKKIYYASGGIQVVRKDHN